MITRIVLMFMLSLMAIGVSAEQIMPNNECRIVTSDSAVQYARDSIIVKAGGGFIYPGENPKANIRRLSAAIDGFGKEGESVWELKVPHKAWGIQVIVLIHPVSEQVHFLYSPWIESSRYKTVRELRDAAAKVYRSARGADRTTDEAVHKITVRTLTEDIPGFAYKNEKVWEIHVLSLSEKGICSVFLMHPIEDKSIFEYAPWDEDKIYLKSDKSSL